MKTKFSCAIADENKKKKREMRTRLFTSSYKAVIQSQAGISRDLESVSGLLWEMHLEETILERMRGMVEPSEADIANCVCQNLKWQADPLEHFAKILMTLSAQAKDDLQKLNVASAID